ncbi:hypothetical protein ACLKOZ_19740 [Arthrobacter sp. R4]|uniref:hypothetical protein n=1 Tax=Arthrobacter sp. R4 TaxID=644417 RepID=UPI003ED95BAF
MTDTAQPTVNPPGDVLIFVPGLGKSESVQLAHVAELLCWELNQQAPDRAATFASVPTSVDAQVVHRIERADGKGAVSAVLDVYIYDAVAELDRNTTAGQQVTRVFTLGLTAAAAVVALVGVILNVRRRAKSRAQLWQALAVVLMVLCIVVYFGIAVVALVEAVVTIVQGESSEPALRWPQWVVLIGAVIGGLLPTAREKINGLGERSVQMARFCFTGVLRNRLSGDLQDLVERVSRRPEVEHIHLLGYSFGSLVAVDTVYPHGASPGQNLKLVDTLITIGSPFDLVRMVRPNYPEGRTFEQDIKPRWVNIYQPIDVLGSNFRDNEESAEATIGLVSSTDSADRRVPEENRQWNPDLKLNLVNMLMLRSLSVHAGYWDDSRTARSALGLAVKSLSARRPILQ